MSKEAIVLDVETTGLSSEKHRIIEISILDLRTGDILLHSYVNPECPIPPKITEITGITSEMVANAPVWAALAHSVRELIEGAPAVIGQNIFFDRDMIDGEARRLVRSVDDPTETPPIQWPILICTKKTWDRYDPREERNLQNAFRRFVDPAGFEKAHSASADTEACRKVYLAQEAEFGLTEVPWEDIDPDRKSWFGTTHHVQWRGADDEPERRQLRVMFGKNRGQPVHEVDVGFWKWVRQRNFDDHILLLSIKMMEDFGPITDDAERETAVTSWAISWQEKQAAKREAAA